MSLTLWTIKINYFHITSYQVNRAITSPQANILIYSDLGGLVFGTFVLGGLVFGTGVLPGSVFGTGVLGTFAISIRKYFII